jgi:hypothetical protein
MGSLVQCGELTRYSAGEAATLPDKAFCKSRYGYEQETGRSQSNGQMWGQRVWEHGVTKAAEEIYWSRKEQIEQPVSDSLLLLAQVGLCSHCSPTRHVRLHPLFNVTLLFVFAHHPTRE